jgi:hypothetical protein
MTFWHTKRPKHTLTLLAHDITLSLIKHNSGNSCCRTRVIEHNSGNTRCAVGKKTGTSLAATRCVDLHSTTPGILHLACIVDCFLPHFSQPLHVVLTCVLKPLFHPSLPLIVLTCILPPPVPLLPPLVVLTCVLQHPVFCI